jgi:hypothetical protein
MRVICLSELVFDNANGHYHRLFGSQHGSQYFEEQVTPDSAWARVSEEMARACADVQSKATTTIQVAGADGLAAVLERLEPA